MNEFSFKDVINGSENYWNEKENLIKNITIESPEINKKLKKEPGEKEKIIDKKRKSKKTKSKELER